MALLFENIQASTTTDLVTAVDAFFAGVATDIQVRRFDPICRDELRREGLELEINIEYETGGAVQTSPYVLNLFRDENMTDAMTAAKVFTDASAALFLAPSRFCMIDAPRLEGVNLILIMSCVDQADGTTNWNADIV